jgi:hypothetical protein
LYSNILQREEAERKQKEDTKRMEKERVEKIKKEEEERNERKKVIMGNNSYCRFCI